MTPANYLIYLRKSRADGELETVEEILSRHEELLQNYAATHLGGPVPECNIFREIVSGETVTARPEMQKLLRLIESPSIVGVLVVDPARLTRGDLSDCGLIVSSFQYAHTEIVTPFMTFHLDNKYERKAFESELVRGNDYLEYTKEILSRGRTSSRREGKFTGNVPPYGYSREKLNKEKGWVLVPNPEEAPAVPIIFDLYHNQHMGANRIGYELDRLGFKPRTNAKWSVGTIRSILTNPVYIGKISSGSRVTEKVLENGQLVKKRPRKSLFDIELFDGRHPALIDEKIFWDVQEMMLDRKRDKPNNIVNPLAGLVFCPCGRAMSYRTYTNNGVERSAPRLLCNDQHHCHNRSALFSEVYPLVITSLEAALQEFRVSMQKNETPKEDMLRSRIASTEAELTKLDRQEENQYTLLEQGHYDFETFSTRNEILRNKRKELSATLKHLEREAKKTVDYQSFVVTLAETIETLKDESVPAKERNLLLSSVVKRIEYTNKSPFNNPHKDSKISLKIELSY